MLISKAVQILMYSVSKFMYLIFPGKRKGFTYECTWISEESRYTDSQLEVAHPKTNEHLGSFLQYKLLHVRGLQSLQNRDELSN